MEIKSWSGTVLLSVPSNTLANANLRGANLRGADLHGADLRNADLQSANLRGANLQSADLHGANLQSADLLGADLHGADLRNADLQSANLRGANLQSAVDDKTIWPHFQLCPERGSFIAWKATSEGVIRVRIPKDAQRTSSLVGRKCRASHVIVLGGRGVGGVSKHDGTTRYNKGATVRANSFDSDPKVECTNGIHFFMSRAEALEWV
jgi:hypothetical protein